MSSAEYEDLTKLCNLPANKKLILFKIPKDLPIKTLDGVVVDNDLLFDVKFNNQVCEKSIQNLRFASIKKVEVFNRLRPIVRDKEKKIVSFGSEFRNVISIYESKDTPTESPNNADKCVAHINYAYSPLDQVNDLRVRSLPDGSLTSIEQLWKEKKMTVSKPSAPIYIPETLPPKVIKIKKEKSSKSGSKSSKETSSKYSKESKDTFNSKDNDKKKYYSSRMSLSSYETYDTKRKTISNEKSPHKKMKTS